MPAKPFEQFVAFLHTPDLEQTSRFYAGTLGLPLVRDQGTCRIFRAASAAYLGFCTHLDAPRPEGVILTLVSDNVDGWYERLLALGVEFVKAPAHNPQYRIYHCFFKDPNGYLLEIQRFDEPLE
jgi:catechol 2,3-dioxygenase-like lactoylglutathione lyase family enzyme